MMNKRIRNLLLWAIPVLFISCAHTTTQKYEALWAKLFKPASYQIANNAIDLGDNGFVIEGNLENRPYNLVVVFDYSPNNLVFLDSARTDSLGNFKLQSVLKEERICYVQFGDRLGFPTALNNKTKMNLKIRAAQGGVSYQLEGKNIESAQQIKSLSELNSGYLFKLNALQMQAMGYDPNANTKEKMQLAAQNMVKMQGERKQALINQQKASKPSIAPYFLTKFLLQEPTYKDIQWAYEQCNKYNSNSSYTRILKGWASQERGTAIGFPAKDFTQKTPQGTDLSLSSLKGNVVLIDFWASWCRPCMSAMPELKRLNNTYKTEKFKILGVSLDRDSTRWARTITIQNLNWLHVSDLGFWSNKAAKMYGVRSIPATFLIDKKGNIAAKNLHGTALEMKIKELLAE
jgi:peroxiredoxin